MYLGVISQKLSTGKSYRGHDDIRQVPHPLSQPKFAVGGLTQSGCVKVFRHCVFFDRFWFIVKPAKRQTGMNQILIRQ